MVNFPEDWGKGHLPEGWGKRSALSSEKNKSTDNFDPQLLESSLLSLLIAIQLDIKTLRMYDASKHISDTNIAG